MAMEHRRPAVLDIHTHPQALSAAPTAPDTAMNAAAQPWRPHASTLGHILQTWLREEGCARGQNTKHRSRPLASAVTKMAKWIELRPANDQLVGDRQP